MSKEKVQRKDPKQMNLQEKSRYIAQLRERDNEMVTGVFQNLETRGGSLRFSYKFYPGDDYKDYEFYDGERYTIPRGVARHINNDCYYKEYKHLDGQSGETGMRAAFNDGRLRADKMQAMRKVHRFAFRSLDFMDDDLDMYPSNIVEVSVSP